MQTTYDTNVSSSCDFKKPQIFSCHIPVITDIMEVLGKLLQIYGSYESPDCFLSSVVYYRILNIVPCAVEDIVVYLLCI